ncbi:hypothetical protein LTR66_008752 [Elasticomyces elasticus]|nr:hypothetical protein LTR28_003538 [Elasticomyces elasticus]KAK4983652.1 hypothetical protein LTR66_008752 [Elasticomyces elasticus]
MEQPVWLITGASSGLGLSIALSALRVGGRVLATARNPAKAAQDHPEVEQRGGKWIALDVAKSDCKAVVQRVVESEGRVDVVVNSAGYSLLGAVEDMSENEIHDQMNTNFYGPIRVIQGALPTMRKQMSGTIVNISSTAGISGVAACGLYAASKFALEGLSEALASELSAFNIHMLVVEPGAFRTAMIGNAVSPAAGLSEPYIGTAVNAVLDRYAQIPEKAPGDPPKAGEVIVHTIKEGMSSDRMNHGHLRLILGSDSLARIEMKAQKLMENVVAMKEVAKSTDRSN